MASMSMVGIMDSWETIDVAGLARFTDIRRVTETDSTNTQLVALAKAGAPEGIVLMADHQRAGKGRLGRVWQAQPGASLLVSVLVRPSVAPERAHLVTIAAALAAVDACSEVAGIRPLLKWPNDLVIETSASGQVRKLAGLLSESVIEDGKLTALIIGMGLNVNWPEVPDELADIAVALNHLSDVNVERVELLGKWLLHFEDQYSALTGGDKSREQELLDRYRQACFTLGQNVRVELSDGSVEGRAIDIDDGGHLLIKTRSEDGTLDLKQITAGDVIHVRPS